MGCSHILGWFICFDTILDDRGLNDGWKCDWSVIGIITSSVNSGWNFDWSVSGIINISLNSSWEFAWSVSGFSNNHFDSLRGVFLRSMIFQFVIDQGTLHVISCQCEYLVKRGQSILNAAASPTAELMDGRLTCPAPGTGLGQLSNSMGQNQAAGRGGKEISDAMIAVRTH